MKTISLRLSDELDALLEALRAERGTSKSELVREALEEYTRGESGRRPGSCLDLASDLAGSLAGPEDLASNKRHLKGYGR